MMIAERKRLEDEEKRKEEAAEIAQEAKLERQRKEMAEEFARENSAKQKKHDDLKAHLAFQMKEKERRDAEIAQAAEVSKQTTAIPLRRWMNMFRFAFDSSGPFKEK